MKWSCLKEPYFLASVLVTMLVLFPDGKLQPEEEVKYHSLPTVGDLAPDFTLEDFQGDTFAFSQLRNQKATLLWFTNLCAGCEMKLPKMETFHNLFQEKGVEVVAVSQLGKDRKTVEDAIRRNKLSFRFLYDPEGVATEYFSGKYVPGTCPLQNIYIIQKDGKIAYASHYPGAEESEIMAQLTKTIGEK